LKSRRNEKVPRANVNGINIYYQDHGEGEPLVLIQGFGGGHEGWFFQTRSFRKHHRVIVFDNRGMGKSDKSPEPYTIVTMTEDTINLMDYLGLEKAHILGTSLGGIVAQELAISYPERVNKLVLVSTHTGEGEVSDVHPDLIRVLGIDEEAKEMNLESVDFHESIGTIVALSFNRKIYRTILVPMAKYQIRRVGIDGYLEQMKAVQGHVTYDRLERIEAQTLVLTGSEDRIVSSRASKRIAELIPDSKLVVVEGGSHAFNIEMKSRFNREVLDF
jgi:pimeloyl-ACP methyl ester carboxylesterase